MHRPEQKPLDADKIPSHAYEENLIDAPTIIIFFSSIGVNSSNKPFELSGLLDRTDCASIVLRDIESSWYLAMQDFPPDTMIDFLRARFESHS